jgi:hypothetical protein
MVARKGSGILRLGEEARIHRPTDYGNAHGESSLRGRPGSMLLNADGRASTDLSRMRHFAERYLDTNYFGLSHDHQEITGRSRKKAMADWWPNPIRTIDKNAYTNNLIPHFSEKSALRTPPSLSGFLRELIASKSSLDNPRTWRLVLIRSNRSQLRDSLQPAGMETYSHSDFSLGEWFLS